MIIKERFTTFTRCCVCGEIIPANKLVLRNDVTGRVICLTCTNEIAEGNDAITLK